MSQKICQVHVMAVSAFLSLAGLQELYWQVFLKEILAQEGLIVYVMKVFWLLLPCYFSPLNGEIRSGGD